MRKLVLFYIFIIMQGAIRIPGFIILLALLVTFFMVHRALETVPPFTIESAPPPTTIEKNLFNYEGWKRVLLDALGRIHEGEPLTQSQEAVLEVIRQKLLLHKASEKDLAEELLTLLENNPDEGQQRSDHEPQPGDQ